VGYWYGVGSADWKQKLYCSYFPTGEECSIRLPKRYQEKALEDGVEPL
jgi:hypothetical protein